MTTSRLTSDDEEKLSKPDSKSGILQRQALVKLRERGPEELPTNIRFLFYELVMDGAIPKHRESQFSGKKGRRADQDLIDAVTRLREIGLVPWWWIIDETREISSWRSAPTVADYLLDSVKLARIDPWNGKPPMNITESRSLAGVLNNLAREYLGNITSVNGQCAGHLRVIARSLSPGSKVGYLGDHDRSGGDIEQNTRDVLERLIGGELDWERIAITPKQIKRWRLIAVPKLDRRDGQWHDAYETEALGQRRINEILRRWYDAQLPEPLADVLERQEEQRRQMRAALERLARKMRR